MEKAIKCLEKKLSYYLASVRGVQGDLVPCGLRVAIETLQVESAFQKALNTKELTDIEKQLLRNHLR